MSEKMNTSIPEPDPKGGKTAVWDLVIKDMQDRDNFGREKYGQRLLTHDGRVNLIDLYQEILDAAVYIRKEIEERKECTCGRR